MKVFIVEDEVHSRKTLINFLTKYHKQCTVVGSAETVSEAIKKIVEVKPELLFLDIDLPDGNGFEILNHLSQPWPAVIFVTAYNQYAVKAFQVSAIDYLLKPVDPELLKKAIDKVSDITTSQSDNVKRSEAFSSNTGSKLNKLALPTLNGIHLVKIDEVIRIEADGNYSKIFLENGENILVSKSLKTFDTWLEGLSFFRVHHSHIINLNFLHKYIKGEGGTAILENGDEIEVSRRRKEEFVIRISSQ
jgi:two-component system LytT family response regulator